MNLFNFFVRILAFVLSLIAVLLMRYWSVLLPYKENVWSVLVDKRLANLAAGLACLPYKVNSGSKVCHFGAY